MAVNDIGRVTPIWRGIYSAERAYELNDIVLDAEGSVWWHVSEEITTGTAPGSGEVWAAVIDMRIFSAAIQTAIAEAQEAVREAEEAAGTLEEYAERAEAAASEATLSAGAASDFATAASDEKREAEAARAGAETAQTGAETAQSAAETAQSAAETAQTAAETARSGAQTAKTGAEAARDMALTYQQSAAASKDAAELARDKAEEYAEALEVQIDPTFKTPGTGAESVAVSKKTASAVTASASGNPVVLPDAAGERVMRSVRVSIEPVQAGSGDPSPDNVRPISGWTGAVIRCGASLVDDYGWTAGMAIDSSGEIQTVTTNRKLSAKIPVSGLTKITGMAWTDDATQQWPFRIAAYDESDGFLSMLLNATVPVGRRVYVAADKTIPEGTAYVRMSVIGTCSAAVFDASVFAGQSVEFPSEAGTVYGGTLDLTAGTLTVDRLYKSLDGTEGWSSGGTAGTDRAYFYLAIGAGGSVVDNSGICSHFMPVNITGSSTDVGQRIVNSSANNARLLIRPEDAANATVTTFKAWLAAQAAANTPVQVCWKLTEPAVYTMDAGTIAALAGLNIVFADCGPVEIEYVRDTGAAIEAANADTRAMIGEASGETASRSLAVGEYVTVGAALYRVTAAIAEGETLAPGTNVVETTVGAELVRLAGMLAQ